MSHESQRFAGILLITIPTVMYGGLTLLGALTKNAPGYNDNPLRHDPAAVLTLGIGLSRA